MFRFVLILLLTVTTCSVADVHYVSFTTKDDHDALVEQKDLKLQVEGKEAAIKEFFFVDTLHPKQKTLLHPAGRRQHIILLDLVFSKPDEILRARAWMEDLAAKAGEYDLFAIGAITQLNGLRWFCHLTSDRNQVRAGWNTITKEKPVGFTQGPEGNLYPSKFQDSASVILLSEDAFRKNLNTVSVKTSTEQDQFIVVQGLVDAAFLLSTIEGRKNVYFITPGFDAKGLRINLDLGKRKKPAVEGQPESEPATYEGMTESFRDPEALEKMAISRRGPPKQMGVEILPDLYTGTDSRVHVVSATTERNGFLEDLTSKTAGLYHLGNFDSARVLNSDRFYYVVGWEEIEADKALCSIQVSVENRNLQSPEKWLIPKYYEEYTQDEKRTKISEAIFKNYGESNPGHHFWSDFYFEGGLNKIPMFTQISGDSLLRTKADSRTLEVYGFVIDPDQSIVDFSSSVIEMDLTNKKLRERIEKSGLKVWQILLGSAKPMQIRWIVLDSQNGEIVTHSAVLDVKENEMTISNPFVPSTDMQWIVWPKPTDKITHRGVELRYPYNTDGGVFFPDLAPEINPSDKNRVVYFKLYNLLPESRNPPVRFHLLDSKGNASEVSEFQLLRKPAPLEHQGMELFWSVNAFPDVQPGSYRFRVDVLEPASKDGIAAEINLLQIKES